MLGGLASMESWRSIAGRVWWMTDEATPLFVAISWLTPAPGSPPTGVACGSGSWRDWRGALVALARCVDSCLYPHRVSVSAMLGRIHQHPLVRAIIAIALIVVTLPLVVPPGACWILDIKATNAVRMGTHRRPSSFWRC